MATDSKRSESVIGTTNHSSNQHHNKRNSGQRHLSDPAAYEGPSGGGESANSHHPHHGEE